jgi:hypothetical protein
MRRGNGRTDQTFPRVQGPALCTQEQIQGQCCVSSCEKRHDTIQATFPLNRRCRDQLLTEIAPSCTANCGKLIEYAVVQWFFGSGNWRASDVKASGTGGNGQWYHRLQYDRQGSNPYQVNLSIFLNVWNLFGYKVLKSLTVLSISDVAYTWQSPTRSSLSWGLSTTNTDRLLLLGAVLTALAIVHQAGKLQICYNVEQMVVTCKIICPLQRFTVYCYWSWEFVCKRRIGRRICPINCFIFKTAQQIQGLHPSEL